LRDFVKRFVELSGYVKTVYFSNKGGGFWSFRNPHSLRAAGLGTAATAALALATYASGLPTHS